MDELFSRGGQPCRGGRRGERGFHRGPRPEHRPHYRNNRGQDHGFRRGNRHDFRFNSGYQQPPRPQLSDAERLTQIIDNENLRLAGESLYSLTGVSSSPMQSSSAWSSSSSPATTADYMRTPCQVKGQEERELAREKRRLMESLESREVREPRCQLYGAQQEIAPRENSVQLQQNDSPFDDMSNEVNTSEIRENITDAIAYQSGSSFPSRENIHQTVEPAGFALKPHEKKKALVDQEMRSYPTGKPFLKSNEVSLMKLIRKRELLTSSNENTQPIDEVMDVEEPVLSFELSDLTEMLRKLRLSLPREKSKFGKFLPFFSQVPLIAEMEFRSNLFVHDSDCERELLSVISQTVGTELNRHPVGQLCKAFDRMNRLAQRMTENLKSTSLAVAAHLFMVQPIHYGLQEGDILPVIGETLNAIEEGKFADPDVYNQVAKGNKDLPVLVKSLYEKPSCNFKIFNQKTVWNDDTLQDDVLRCHTPVTGYYANKFWKYGNTIAHFCMEHSADILSKNFCPYCLLHEDLSNAVEIAEDNQGLICRGTDGKQPAHYFHLLCVDEKICPHCGSGDVGLWEKLSGDPPNWASKRIPSSFDIKYSLQRFLKTPAGYRKVSQLVPENLPRYNAEKIVPIFITKTIKLPEPKDVPTKPSYERGTRGKQKEKEIANGRQVIFAPTTRKTKFHVKQYAVTEVYCKDLYKEDKIGVFDKYAHLFTDFCAEIQDGRLSVSGLDTQSMIVKECSEVCGCCVRKCSNRVTQMPSKVSLKVENGHLKVTHPVKRGEFICRLTGTLSDAVPSTDMKLPTHFFLPQMPFWSEQVKTSQLLCIIDVPYPAGQIRKVANISEATTVAVMIVDSPSSLAMGFPRHLAPVSVAFFAAKNLRPKSVVTEEQKWREREENRERAKKQLPPKRVKKQLPDELTYAVDFRDAVAITPEVDLMRKDQVEEEDLFTSGFWYEPNL